MMDVKVIQYYLDVIGHKNISKAAQKHFVSQPALSLQIKKLEDSYGTPLLVRNSKGVEPTEAGKIVADKYKSILDLYHRSYEEVSCLQEGKETVRIESNLTLSTYALPFLIYELQQRKEFESCYFDLTFNTSGPVENNIISGISQIGFVQKEEGKLIIDQIACDQLVLVAEKSYNIPEQIDLSDLVKYPLIEAYDKFSERKTLAESLAPHLINMRELNVKLTLHSTESVKTALFGQIGIGFLPRISVRKELKSGDLKEIKIRNFKEEYPIYLVHMKDERYSPVVREVISFLKKSAHNYF